MRGVMRFVMMALTILSQTAFGALDVQKSRVEDLYNDDLVVTNVVWRGSGDTGIDTNAVKDITKPFLDRKRDKSDHAVYEIVRTENTDWTWTSENKDLEAALNEKRIKILYDNDTIMWSVNEDPSPHWSYTPSQGNEDDLSVVMYFAHDNDFSNLIPATATRPRYMDETLDPSTNAVLAAVVTNGTGKVTEGDLMKLDANGRLVKATASDAPFSSDGDYVKPEILNSVADIANTAYETASRASADSELALIRIGNLSVAKQDALPYPTNAIPANAIYDFTNAVLSVNVDGATKTELAVKRDKADRAVYSVTRTENTDWRVEVSGELADVFISDIGGVDKLDMPYHDEYYWYYGPLDIGGWHCDLPEESISELNPVSSTNRYTVYVKGGDEVGVRFTRPRYMDETLGPAKPNQQLAAVATNNAAKPADGDLIKYDAANDRFVKAVEGTDYLKTHQDISGKFDATHDFDGESASISWEAFYLAVHAPHGLYVLRGGMMADEYDELGRYVRTHSLFQKADRATTLSGYGITDGATKTELAAKRDLTDNVCRKTEFTEWICNPPRTEFGGVYSIRYDSKVKVYSLFDNGEVAEEIYSPTDDKLNLEFVGYCTATRSAVCTSNELFVTQSFVTNAVNATKTELSSKRDRGDFAVENGEKAVKFGEWEVTGRDVQPGAVYSLRFTEAELVDQWDLLKDGDVIDSAVYDKSVAKSVTEISPADWFGHIEITAIRPSFVYVDGPDTLVGAKYVDSVKSMISATDLTFSSAVNASISGLSASKITSGTFPDSRIASASVWNGKQAKLVSGSNIKTINNQSILGSGNIEISAPQPAAEKRYAMFIIRLNETAYDDQAGHFTQFELKASTNNFSTAYSQKDRCCFYSHSGHAEGEFSTNDGMHLFINHGGADQRSYVRIKNTAEGMPNYAPAEVIVIVDAALMNRDRSDGSWLYEGNEDVMWTWVRTKDNTREFDGDADHCLWRPITPVRWYSTLPNWAREGL